MANTNNPPENRSVTIGGNAEGNVIQTGNNDTAFLHYQKAHLPAPHEVDITAELHAIRELLSRLDTPDRKKIENALGEAQDELQRTEPDKNEIGKALDRALDYAKKAEGFAKVIANLKPHVSAAAAWLGTQWYSILAAVGLVV